MFVHRTKTRGIFRDYVDYWIMRICFFDRQSVRFITLMMIVRNYARGFNEIIL